MRASTLLASPTPACFAPREEETRGRATALKAYTNAVRIVVSDVEGSERARAVSTAARALRRIPKARKRLSPAVQDDARSSKTFETQIVRPKMHHSNQFGNTSKWHR